MTHLRNFWRTFGELMAMENFLTFEVLKDTIMNGVFNFKQRQLEIKERKDSVAFEIHFYIKLRQWQCCTSSTS